MSKHLRDFDVAGALTERGFSTTKYRGAWTSLGVYKPGDIVLFAKPTGTGGTYVCLTAVGPGGWSDTSWQRIGYDDMTTQDIPAGTDLNSLTVTGTWAPVHGFPGTLALNYPTTDYGVLEVIRGDYWCAQQYITRANVLYQRTSELPTGIWTQWAVVYPSDVPDAAVQNSNQPPVVHGQTWYDKDDFDQPYIGVDYGATALINLLTNPSMEKAATPVNGMWTRLNLNQNPRAGVTSSATAGYWQHQSGTTEAGTFARVTGAVDGPLPGVSTYYRWTVTTAKTAGTSGAYARNASGTPAASMNGSSGDNVTASMYVRPSVTLSLQLGLTPRAAGATAGTVKNSTVVSCPAGVWTRLSTSHVTTAAYDDIQVFEIEGAEVILPVGGTMDIACVLVERTTLLDSFFDGASTSTDVDLTPVWDGTAHASVSYMRGTAPATTTLSTTGASSIWSTRWASQGTHSLRVVPQGSLSSISYATIGGGTNNTDLGVTPGKTYTLLARLWLEAPQTGSLDASARTIAFRYNTVAGTSGATYVRSAQAPNTAGVHALRVVVTLPADTVWTSLYFGQGGTYGSGDVWFDDIMLVEGNYTGDYFDGDFGGVNWSGAPHASTSVYLGPSWVQLDLAGGTVSYIDPNDSGVLVIEESDEAGPAPSTYLVPTGAVMPFAGAVAPVGWLLCNGAQYSYATYPALATVLGVGSGNFNVPNLKGKVVVGLDASQAEFDTMFEPGGAKTVTLDGTMIPAHTHPMTGAAPMTSPGYAQTAALDGTNPNRYSMANGGTALGTGAQVGTTGQPHNNLQPYLVLQYIIKT